PDSALFGMLLTGTLVLSVWVWLSGTVLVWPLGTLWLLGLSGVGIMLATLLLYGALARGPVTLVAPIVASYPVVVLLIAVVLGQRPSPLQWAAMALVMAGVVAVSRAGGRLAAIAVERPGEVRRTVLMALASSCGFGIAISAAQAAVPVYGDLQTVWAGRAISLLAILMLFAGRWRRPVVSAAWWPLVMLQGLLDSGAYLALFAGSSGAGAAIAAVVASAFGVVTVLLARVFLREAMSPLQWAGTAVVFAGVAVLTLAGAAA
ncbi:MAG: DMT family transporter, partial [Alphaproteobacteria bacterium]